MADWGEFDEHYNDDSGDINDDDDSGDDSGDESGDGDDDSGDSDDGNDYFFISLPANTFLRWLRQCLTQ